MVNMDWCATMSAATSMKNKYIKTLLKEFRHSAPRLFTPCPFIGEVTLRDIPPQKQFVSIIPKGKWMIKVSVKDKFVKFLAVVMIEFLMN
jgi:hypothetical protein